MQRAGQGHGASPQPARVIAKPFDFSMDVERVPDPKGDRVEVTMNGKFLPYKSY